MTDPWRVLHMRSQFWRDLWLLLSAPWIDFGLSTWPIWPKPTLMKGVGRMHQIFAFSFRYRPSLHAAAFRSAYNLAREQEGADVLARSHQQLSFRKPQERMWWPHFRCAGVYWGWRLRVRLPMSVIEIARHSHPDFERRIWTVKFGAVTEMTMPPVLAGPNLLDKPTDLSTLMPPSAVMLVSENQRHPGFEREPTDILNNPIVKADLADELPESRRKIEEQIRREAPFDFDDGGPNERERRHGVRDLGGGAYMIHR